MFKLHIWGPAFNLPSIDPECIAAIALLNDVLAYDEWLLVIDHDPSASPSSNFPCLYSPHTTEPLAGFTSISHHLANHNPRHNLLHTPEQDQPTHAALTSHLQTHAAPLIAATLHADPLNYSTSTQPSLAAILPFPYAYLVPPRLHDAALRRSSHLYLTFSSSPDDLPAAENNPPNPSSSTQSQSQTQAHAQAERGLAASTRRLLHSTRRPPLTSALATSALRERFKLDSAVDALCAPLDALLLPRDTNTDIETSHALLLPRDTNTDIETSHALLPSGLSTADALALGHLTLLLHASTPRAWCAQRISQRWPRVAAYTSSVRARLLRDFNCDARDVIARAAAPLEKHHMPLPYTLAPQPSPPSRALAFATAVLDAAAFPSTTARAVVKLSTPATYTSVARTPLAALSLGLFCASGLLVAAGTAGCAGRHVLPRLLPEGVRPAVRKREGVVFVFDGREPEGGAGLSWLWGWVMRRWARVRVVGDDGEDVRRNRRGGYMSGADVGYGLESLGRSMDDALSGVNEIL